MSNNPLSSSYLFNYLLSLPRSIITSLPLSLTLHSLLCLPSLYTPPPHSLPTSLSLGRFHALSLCTLPTLLTPISIHTSLPLSYFLSLVSSLSPLYRSLPLPCTLSLPILSFLLPSIFISLPLHPCLTTHLSLPLYLSPLPLPIGLSPL